jgi:hypothetical protein
MTTTVDIATSALWSVEKTLTAVGMRIVEKRATEGACGYTTITITKVH